MATMKEWIEASPSRKNLVAQERLIALVAEQIYAAIEDDESSKAALAKALGKSKAFVTQILSGTRNLTLRTVADIATALGRTPQFELPREHAESDWQPLQVASFVQLRSRAGVRFPCPNDGEVAADELRAA